jgi:hypothetical protein
LVAAAVAEYILAAAQQMVVLEVLVVEVETPILEVV